MHDYEYIYPRGLYTDKEGGTTDASYPKDIFDKFPLRNWNKFSSKFFLTYFSPHVEKEPFFFYILTDCGVSAEAHGRLRFWEESCLIHVSSRYEYGRDILNGLGLATCTPPYQFCHISGKKRLFKDC